MKLPTKEESKNLALSLIAVLIGFIAVGIYTYSMLEAVR